MATFKTRARTLDMLGRQQIAGIPTAISELFKNAYDAYADHVEIDYYRSDGLFVLRDDGRGMTEQEFTDRWLTIGTESKLDSTQHASYRPGTPRRPMLGEKGIGRLAIATIGPQVLVLTRAVRDDSRSDLTIAFINWGLFGCPGIDLDDIRIPIRSLRGGDLPSGADVSDMVAEFRRSNQQLERRIAREDRERLDRELRQFTADPGEIDRYLGAPTLKGSGTGTHFILLPASELLAEDIDGDPTDDKAPPLKKALLGFTNTLSINKADPIIRTAFRDHNNDPTYDDLIADGEFFTEDEFRNSDHHVTGIFDEYGQFSGEVSIFGEAITDHIIPWRNQGGVPTVCGPFRIRFAAIEGEARHSTLPAQEHSLMASKTSKLGGLYIYRDGVRILPYGDTDNDWLDIEFRRTKSAYYYYFSHRKMFGVVQLDSRNNAQLHEKAGREGFQENKAYRQFRNILRSFLVQMAADFFRKEGIHSERFDDRKQELEQMELDRRRRERLVAEKRRQLKQDMDAFFIRVENHEPQEEALRLSSGVVERLRKATQISDRQQAAQEILRVERDARSSLTTLESSYRIVRPRIGLSREMQREWNSYEVAYSDLTTNVFREARELIESVVADEAEKARIAIDRKLRIETALNELADQAKRSTRDRGAKVRQEADNVAAGVRDVARTCLTDVESELRVVISEFQRIDASAIEGDDFGTQRDALESRIRRVWEERSERLDSIRSQLDAVDLSGGTSAIDQLVAVEQRNVLLEEEAAADLQLAQLGMAIEIINHEFNATVRSLRNNLRSLKAWADVNAELDALYRNLRASFDHLDGYLTLFTPLHRRLYRRAVEIRGSETYEFLSDLFRERIARHGVQLAMTDRFAESTMTGYPSSFYPVYVNLVDNAIYWLSGQNPSLRRRIELDARNGVYLVSDSGPGISARDREVVFEYGFTRKPGGRGMGLAISREALRRVGYDLKLAAPKQDKGTSFLIGPTDTATEGADGAG